MRRFMIIAVVFTFSLSRAAFADGLILSFKVDSLMTPAPNSVTSQNGTTQKALVQEMHRNAKVYLYPDVMIFDNGDSGQQRFDFTAKEQSRYDTAKKTFFSTPLAAQPIFLAREKFNRLQMQAMLDAALVGKVAPDKDLAALDLDMAFGAANDRSLSPLPAPVVTGDKATYALNGKPVFDITYSATVVPEALKNAYARFLTYGPTLHPLLEKALAENGHVPAALHSTVREMNGETSSSWTLEKAEPVSGDAPASPLGYVQSFTGNDNVDAAMRKGLSDPAPTIEGADARMQGYLDSHDLTRAALAASQMTLELGGESVKQSKVFGPAMRAAAADPAARLLFTAIARPPQTPEELKQIETVFETARKAAPDFGFLLDVFHANHLRALYGRKRVLDAADGVVLNQASVALAQAVIADPQLVGAYCDLATGYFNNYEIPTAFAILGQAARMRPAYPAVADFVNMKARAEKDFPEYF